MSRTDNRPKNNGGRVGESRKAGNRRVISKRVILMQIAEFSRHDIIFLHRLYVNRFVSAL